MRQNKLYTKFDKVSLCSFCAHFGVIEAKQTICQIVVVPVWISSCYLFGSHYLPMWSYYGARLTTWRCKAAKGFSWAHWVLQKIHQRFWNYWCPSHQNAYEGFSPKYLWRISLCGQKQRKWERKWKFDCLVVDWMAGNTRPTTYLGRFCKVATTISWIFNLRTRCHSIKGSGT